MNCPCTQTQEQIENRQLTEPILARGLEPCRQLLSRARLMLRIHSLEGHLLAVRALHRAETTVAEDHPKLHRSIRAARVRLEMRGVRPDFEALAKIILVRKGQSQ